jgi:hypothetical protein
LQATYWEEARLAQQVILASSQLGDSAHELKKLQRDQGKLSHHKVPQQQASLWTWNYFHPLDTTSSDDICIYITLQ